jgi:hypothetical protein
MRTPREVRMRVDHGGKSQPNASHRRNRTDHKLVQSSDHNDGIAAAKRRDYLAAPGTRRRPGQPIVMSRTIAHSRFDIHDAH